MNTVKATKAHRINEIWGYRVRTPSANNTAPMARETIPGIRKFFRRLPREDFRQAKSGPTPVRNSSSSPMGMFTLLKKGAPTLIFTPCTASEITGNNVPQSTEKQAASNKRLLKRKLLSRETSESNWLWLFR